jgi:hypothetical protein
VELAVEVPNTEAGVWGVELAVTVVPNADPVPKDVVGVVPNAELELAIVVLPKLAVGVVPNTELAVGVAVAPNGFFAGPVVEAGLPSPRPPKLKLPEKVSHSQKSEKYLVEQKLKDC